MNSDIKMKFICKNDKDTVVLGKSPLVVILSGIIAIISIAILIMVLSKIFMGDFTSFFPSSINGEYLSLLGMLSFALAILFIGENKKVTIDLSEQTVRISKFFVTEQSFNVGDIKYLFVNDRSSIHPRNGTAIREFEIMVKLKNKKIVLLTSFSREELFVSYSISDINQLMKNIAKKLGWIFIPAKENIVMDIIETKDGYTVNETYEAI